MKPKNKQRHVQLVARSKTMQEIREVSYFLAAKEKGIRMGLGHVTWPWIHLRACLVRKMKWHEDLHPGELGMELES